MIVSHNQWRFTFLTDGDGWSLSACNSSLKRLRALERSWRARMFSTSCSARRCTSAWAGLTVPSPVFHTIREKVVGLVWRKVPPRWVANQRMNDWSIPGGDDAILELERLWIDSLRAAASGEALERATSIMHSTRARTKLSLANVSLCSFYNKQKEKKHILTSNPNRNSWSKTKKKKD